MGRVIFYFALAVAAVGCIHSAPVSKLKHPMTVKVVILRDHVHERTASMVPEVVQEEIGKVLKARNLVPEFSGSSLLKQLEQVRDSSTRLRRIAKLLNNKNELLLLVETKVSFYSQLSGRYRWTVSATLNLAPADALDQVHVDRFQLPAVLTYAHEKEDEALRVTGLEISRRLGILLDDFLAGKDKTISLLPATTGQRGYRMHGIYFVLVDRFSNGDRTNDGDVDIDDPEAWHGGDLKGIIDHLDYIRNLGFDTIWMSPVFFSQKEKFLGHGAFHGYWTLDPTKVDPKFGTAELLKKLTIKAHNLGLKIILDLVLNHVGYNSPLVTMHPDWFHHRGTITNWKDHEQLLNNEVHGLPDLAQENPVVYSWLLEAALMWLQKVGVDGFRLDAVKHVPLSFWKKFNSALETKRPGVILLGEHYDGDPAEVDRVQRKGHFSHMFDFPMAFALKDVFCSGKPAGKLAAILSNDRLYTKPENLVTFLDNHDVARIRSACGGDLDKVKQALTAQFAIRGIPSVTYGTETGLLGAGEPQNRTDMVFSHETSPGDLAGHIKKLFAIRQANPVLLKGKTRILSYDDGLLSFVRVGFGSEVLVAINSRSEPAKCSLPDQYMTGMDLIEESEVKSPFLVSVGQTRLIGLYSSNTNMFDDYLEKPGETRRIRILLKADCLDRNVLLSVVGSGPELGMWNPERALGPMSPSENGFELKFSLPVDLVFSFKFVIKTADEKIKWENGSDRYLFVQRGKGPLTLNLKWHEC